MIMLIKIAEIIRDPEVQARTSLCFFTVEEYGQAMIEGAAFPPIVVFSGGENKHWLADGWHRVAAAEHAGLKEIEAQVRVGDKRDAVLFAVGSNSAHGIPRTNADKRRAVEILLNDEEWGKWSDRVNQLIIDATLLCAMHHVLGSEVQIVRSSPQGAGFFAGKQKSNIRKIRHAYGVEE